MTLLAPAQNRPHRRRKSRRGHRMAVLLASLLAAGAVALISYLLWPTWRPAPQNDPGRTPVSVGGTLFNVPTKAFRVKVQRHSGPQERVDLSFVYPSLQPPEAPKHVSASSLPELDPPIDRIFLSIAVHNDALAPEARLRTIYPRYFDAAVTPLGDGLSLRGFRDGSPYANEDLFVADEPQLAARCTRDGLTPGMCLSERRIDGADLTFRFPRQWLTQWRELAAAMAELTRRLHSAHG